MRPFPVRDDSAEARARRSLSRQLFRFHPEIFPEDVAPARYEAEQWRALADAINPFARPRPAPERETAPTEAGAVDITRV